MPPIPVPLSSSSWKRRWPACRNGGISRGATKKSCNSGLRGKWPLRSPGELRSEVESPAVRDDFSIVETMAEHGGQADERRQTDGERIASIWQNAVMGRRYGIFLEIQWLASQIRLHRRHEARSSMPAGTNCANNCRAGAGFPNPWLSGYLARLADRTLTPAPIVNSIQLARDGESADTSLYGRHAQTNLMALRCVSLKSNCHLSNLK